MPAYYQKQCHTFFGSADEQYIRVFLNALNLLVIKVLVYLYVKQIKSQTDSNKRVSNFVNPFMKMIEDKKRIAETLKEGKPLSALKEITFVKPI